MIQIFCGYTGLFNCLTCLTISLFVYFKKRSGKINCLFALWSLCVAFWSLGYYMWLFTPNYQSALIWSRILMVGAILIPSTFLHFTLSFIGFEKLHRPFVVAGYAFSVAFLLLDFTPLFVLSVEPRYWFRWWPMPGMLFHVYLLYFIMVVSYCHYLLFKRVTMTTSEVERKQYKIVAFGTLIAFAGGSTNFFLWYNIPVPPVFNFLVTGYVAFIAYAIVSYRLWNIEVIIRKTIAFAGLVAFVFGVVSFGLFVTQEFLALFFGIRWEVALIFSISLVVLGYEPMRAFLIQTTDKYLFQKSYNYQKLLKDASQGIAQIESLHHLLGLVTHFITMRMRIKNALILIKDNKRKEFRLSYNRGYKSGLPVEQSLTIDNPLIVYLEREKEGLDLQQIKAYIDSGGKKSKQGNAVREYDFEAIKGQMNELQVHCCIPSFLGKELRNILLLGEKKSGDYYSNEDLNVLFTLAQESAIAIENARLYDEAIRRTEELQRINEEVERANKELQNAQAQLIHEQKMATLGRLAASVGHEVNNPLTILSMNVSRAILKYKKDPALRVSDILEIFQKMEQNIGRIKAVVNTLTGLLKKSEKGKFEPLSLKLILEETLPLVQFQTYLENTSNTDVEFDIPSDIPLIKGDLERLQEVFLNLFINAYHALAGRTRPKITVRARLDLDDPLKVIIEFSDNGSGMPEEIQKKIFTYGFTTKGPGRGSGMGLYICKYIIELHGGEMRVKSQPGVGTTFTLSLPAFEENNPVNIPAAQSHPV